MTIRHLQIFIEVYRTGSVTKAAERLHLSQPAVSNAIKELETYYGVMLFERMNRKIYITKAGLLLWQYANSILSQLEEVREIIRDEESTSGIRIGSNVAFGSLYLPAILSDFCKKYPDIPIFTRIENSSRMEKAVLHNELDFAIVDTPANAVLFHILPLCTEEMYLVYSPSCKALANQKSEEISLREAVRLPMLLREEGSGSRNIIQKMFMQTGGKPIIISESASTKALISLCLLGQGVLLLPDRLAAPYLESGQLRRLKVKDFNMTRSFVLIYHQSKYLTRSMQHFLKKMEQTDLSAIPLDNDFS